MHPMRFDGETFDPARDGHRLTGQLARVQHFMADQAWHTLPEIVAACGGTTASVSARLRDLRKARFGQRTVQRRYQHDGIWEYRLTKD